MQKQPKQPGRYARLESEFNAVEKAGVGRHRAYVEGSRDMATLIQRERERALAELEHLREQGRDQGRADWERERQELQRELERQRQEAKRLRQQVNQFREKAMLDRQDIRRLQQEVEYVNESLQAGK